MAYNLGNFLKRLIEARHNIGDKSPNAFFYDRSGRRAFERQPENLDLQYRLDILSEMRLSSVVQQI